ncbi:MAG: hypothetical protein JXM75_00545 [Chromatiaceae bacterium]|nr:hypothetical protein [Chromatiaceae bacterium]
MIAGMSINSIRSKSRRRKPDLFSILLIVVALGMSVTLAYQVSLYHGFGDLPLARQAPPPVDIGG